MAIYELRSQKYQCRPTVDQEMTEAAGRKGPETFHEETVWHEVFIIVIHMTNAYKGLAYDLNYDIYI